MAEDDKAHSSPPGADDPFEVAWREVEAHWDEDLHHRRFIALCAAQQALQEAGRRYRKVRDTDPNRREEAGRRIDAVLTAALQRIQATRTEPKPHAARRITWVAFGLSAFFIVYALLSILRARPH
jgi:hypothetical protein